MEKENTTEKRGFASMDPEKKREIASKGGQASHAGTGKDENIKNKNDEKKGRE